MVRNEIAVLKRVSMGHQNILTLVDYFETMNNCKSCIPFVSKYCRFLCLLIRHSLYPGLSIFVPFPPSIYLMTHLCSMSSRSSLRILPVSRSSYSHAVLADTAFSLTVYLVTDLALGGELFDRICRKGSYYESDAADLIRATLSAVAYLHDHGIVHRDLKPENLLFRTPEDNADLLIADFGLSRIMDEEQFHVLTTTCGTPGYMAPEIFKKSGHGKPVYVFTFRGIFITSSS